MSFHLENFEESITLFILALGVITVVISVLVAVKFHIYRKRLDGGSYALSRAISWQLWGEATMGFGTLAFSLGAYMGILGEWSVEFQSFVRFVMFFSTSITTYHLMATLKRL